MFDKYFVYIVILAFVFLVAIISTAIFFRKKKEREKKLFVEKSKVAKVFKDNLLKEVKGLYPIPQFLNEEDIGRFRASIAKVDRAAAEFRPFLDQKNRENFDSVLKRYSGHCRRIRWSDCVATSLMSTKGKFKDVEPKEVFRKNVNALLSFTKESAGSV